MVWRVETRAALLPASVLDADGRHVFVAGVPATRMDMRTARHCPVRPGFLASDHRRAGQHSTEMMMPCGYAFATHSDDHGHFQPAGQAGSGTSAACQRDETDAATTHHTGSQSADISPRCSAASPGRRGRLDRVTGTTPNFAQDSVPAIVFYRQSGLVEYPRDRSICWSAQLVRLEPAGHIPIYERGHEVSARIALFPDELQQSQSG